MPILSLTHKFEILYTTFLGNCEAVWYNGNRLSHPFWSISRFQTPWCSLPAVQHWPSVTSVRQQPTRITGILGSWNNSRSFNKWTAYEGVIGVRKPQREDSHLGPVTASLVLRDGRTRSWRGRERAMERGLLWWREGCLWSRDTDSLRGPNLPSRFSSIWALQGDKSRVEPGVCRGCRDKWKVSSLGDNICLIGFSGEWTEMCLAMSWHMECIRPSGKGHFYLPGITFKLHEFSSCFSVKETLLNKDDP